MSTRDEIATEREERRRAERRERERAEHTHEPLRSEFLTMPSNME